MVPLCIDDSIELAFCNLLGLHLYGNHVDLVCSRCYYILLAKMKCGAYR